MLTIIRFLLPIFLTLLAVWRRAWGFYLLAGFAWMFFGFIYWIVDRNLSILMVFIGFFCMAGAIGDKGK